MKLKNIKNIFAYSSAEYKIIFYYNFFDYKLL